MHLPHFLAIPLSDPRSISAGSVHGTFASNLLPVRVLLGTPRLRLAVLPEAAFLIGLGILKRLGMMDEVTSICSHAISNHRTTKRIKAIAYDSLGDMQHMLWRWRDSVERERHLTHIGSTSCYLRPGDAFFTYENLMQASLAQALEHYQAALAADPDYVAAHYSIARLHCDAGRSEEALRAYDEMADVLTRRAFLPLCFNFITYDKGVIRLLGHGAERHKNDVLALIYGYDPTLYLPNSKALVVDLVENADVPARLGHHRCDITKGEAISLDYHIYADGKPPRRVRRTIESADVFTVQPERLELWSNFMPHALFDGSVMPKACRIYDGVQFNLFDGLMVAHNETQALIARPMLWRELDDIVLCQGYADNYYHFLIDCIGSLAFIPEEIWRDRILVFGGGSPNLKSYQLEILQHCGLSKQPVIKLFNDSRAVVSRNAVTTSNPNRLNIANPKAVRFLRKRLMAEFERSPRPGKSIFLYRADRRRLVGADFERFSSYLAKKGFELVDPGALSVAQQRELLCDAEIVLMEAGAAAANMLFCPRGCQIIILSCEYGYKDIFTPITTTLGQSLHVVLSPSCDIYPKPYLAWSEFWPSLALTDAMMAVDQAILQAQAWAEAS